MQEVFKKMIKELRELKIKITRESRTASRAGTDCIFDKSDILDERAAGVADALKVVRKVLREYNNGWIPCSECLPDEGRFYFVTIEMWNKAYGTEYCLFENGKWYLVADGASDENTTWKEETESVIAWQPLPQPYEPKEG